MQLTVLGSGNAVPTRRRACAGHLVEWSRGACLLDASAGTYVRALAAGLDPLDLRVVALTHFHLDHSADLPAILWARRQEERWPAPLVLAGPDGLGGHVDALRRAYGAWLDTPCEVAGYPFEGSGLRIDAFPARHSPEAVCLRLSADGATLAYSGDTGDCDGLRAACRGADLALIECTSMEAKDGHLTPAECAAVVAAARPRRVLLTHLGADVVTDLPCAEDGLVVAVGPGSSPPCGR